MVEKERRTNQDRREDMKGVSHDLNYNKPERRNTSSDDGCVFQVLLQKST